MKASRKGSRDIILFPGSFSCRFIHAGHAADIYPTLLCSLMLELIKRHLMTSKLTLCHLFLLLLLTWILFAPINYYAALLPVVQLPSNGWKHGFWKWGQRYPILTVGLWAAGSPTFLSVSSQMECECGPSPITDCLSRHHLSVTQTQKNSLWAHARSPTGVKDQSKMCKMTWSSPVTVASEE